VLRNIYGFEKRPCVSVKFSESATSLLLINVAMTVQKI
jgi:hypothetical protein